MKQVKNTLIVLFAIALMSCGGKGDDKDTTPPQISITAPTVSTSVDAGSDLTITATVSDNKALASYTAIIGYSGPKAVKIVNPTRYSFDSNTGTTADGSALPAISGKEATINFDVAVPNDVEGANYKLTITVFDEADNPASADVIFVIN